MAASAFEALEAIYPDVIAQMDKEFDSHDFILKLAQKYQRLYVQALIEYVANDTPFKTVHGEIAKRLHHFSMLVQKTGEHFSNDIFLQNDSASMWVKVKK